MHVTQFSHRKTGSIRVYSQHENRGEEKGPRLLSVYKAMVGPLIGRVRELADLRALLMHGVGAWR